MRKNSPVQSDPEIMDFFDKLVNNEDNTRMKYEDLIKGQIQENFWGNNTPFNDLLASGGYQKFFTLQEDEKDFKIEPLWNKDAHENFSL
jgi:hypothetical protein